MYVYIYIYIYIYIYVYITCFRNSCVYINGKLFKQNKLKKIIRKLI